MRYVRIKRSTNKLFEKCYVLYIKSFPLEERRDKKDQIEVLKNKDYYYEAILEGENFIGLRLYWEYNDCIFFEHLAISHKERNKGYGTKAFRDMQNKGKRIILEVEPPEDKMKEKRIKLYESLGCIINDYDYYQPPYRKGDSPTKLYIMTYPKTINERTYKEFIEFTRNNVYPKF